MINRIKIDLWSKWGVILLLTSFSGMGCSDALEAPPSASSGMIEPSAASAEAETHSEGEVRSGSDSGDTFLSQPAQNLGLKVIQETTASPLAENTSEVISPVIAFQPALDSEGLAELNEMSAEGNVLVVHSKLSLVDRNSKDSLKQKELFFVWPEATLGSRVTAASFSHRVRKSDATVIGNLEPQLAWHDLENHRWYIPIAEIFRTRPQYGLSDASLEDTQFLDLDLILETGRQVNVELRFQVSGALPAFQITSLPVPLITDTRGLIQGASTSGVTVWREAIANPTSRPFSLWVRRKSVHSIQGLGLITSLNVPVFRASREAPPQRELEYYISRGELEVSEIIVRRSTTRQETRLALTSHQALSEWIKVDLKERETITLEWVAKPQASTPRCSLPQTSTLNFTWFGHPTGTTSAQIVGRAAESMIRAFPGAPSLLFSNPGSSHPASGSSSIQTESRQVVWDWQGAQLVGKWSREIRVQHPYTLEEAATSSTPEYAPLISAETSQLFTLIQSGNPLLGRPALNCQGVFP